MPDAAALLALNPMLGSARQARARFGPLAPHPGRTKAQVGCGVGTGHRPGAVPSSGELQTSVPSGFNARSDDQGSAAMLKVLKGGRLIDGTGAGPAANATVVVRDQRIEAVTTRAADEWPQDAEII